MALDDFKDYFKILGVSRNATDKEIKSAFRKLARKFHPDLHPHDERAESEFKEINEAYEILSDEDKKKSYEQFLNYWFKNRDGKSRDFSRENKPILGTCAGAILLSTENCLPQSGLSLINIKIKRNAYGRQLESFVSRGKCPLLGTSDLNLDMVFIRAPQIISLGPQVDVLATHHSHPVWVQQNNIIATTFHPELNKTLEVHKFFLQISS